MQFQDLTGRRFNRLLVIRQHSQRRLIAEWVCRCDCGKEKIVLGGNLRQGLTQSCGCLQRERAVEANLKHGGKYMPEYHVWSGMKDRCSNPKAPHYECYGGRGIGVCERWMKFENFINDMGPRPTPKHSIERKNNELGYSPENCKWATQKEQMQNRRKPTTKGKQCQKRKRR